ncbi:EEF1A lysine methyltransferase 2 isoform X2 [Vombatus ursinus]|nr:EEF1A lysine methyltransferase 2 isoform X2 [Vombatus ursinus]XP_027711695.1 EEF1A lysine methyltransferase 2 isoform X2 [Vombatus ursinus]
MNRLIKWMEKRKIPLDASVLDIGTGNGIFLVELAKLGYSDVTGIDYSPLAIQLSGRIIEKEGLPNIKLQAEDFLNPSTKLSGFHVCIDKGTFDAISLNPDSASEKRKQYVKSLSRALQDKGFFLITSCNWTKDELLNEFSEGFEILEELPTPTFTFGGRSGNSVTALVFQKNFSKKEMSRVGFKAQASEARLARGDDGGARGSGVWRWGTLFVPPWNGCSLGTCEITSTTNRMIIHLANTTPQRADSESASNCILFAALGSSFCFFFLMNIEGYL